MPLELSTVENILRSDTRLQVLYDEGYELSFQSEAGLQIAINRKSVDKAIRLWIQNTLNPKNLPLSPGTEIKHYPATKARAHLSASRLTGPYKGRLGNDCWYISFTAESDVRTLVAAYLSSAALATAPVIPSGLEASSASDESPQLDEHDLEDEAALFPEGAASYRLHRHLERDGSLPLRAKEKRLREAGCLSCDVCGFDFLAQYGELGAGYIEAHHTKPVSNLDGNETTNIADLSLVCSNCHRMLHRGGSPMVIDDLRQLLNGRKKET